MREEIIEIILRGFGLGWSEQELADAVLSIIPEKWNFSLWEGLDKLPNMVAILKDISGIPDEDCHLHCVVAEPCEDQPEHSKCLIQNTIRLLSGELMEVRKEAPCAKK